MYLKIKNKGLLYIAFMKTRRVKLCYDIKTEINKTSLVDKIIQNSVRWKEKIYLSIYLISNRNEFIA